MARKIDPDAKDTPKGNSAGRVEFDSRGNSVWRWTAENDESTSILLKQLENEALELEPTRKVPVQPQRATEGPGGAGAGRHGKASAGKTGSGGRPASSASGRGSGLEVERGSNDGGFDPYNHG